MKVRFYCDVPPSYHPRVKVLVMKSEVEKCRLSLYKERNNENESFIYM